MNLCIIITGQLRSFFNKTEKYFLEMYNLSKANYNNILIIVVISGNYNLDELENYFKKLKINYLIIDYNFYIDDFKNNLNKKVNDSNFIKLKNNYINNPKYDVARKYIDEPIHNNHWFKSGNIQFHQLNIGINQLLKFEKKNNINYDVIMKTRFDMIYWKNFYPHLPELNMTEKLLLSDKNIELYNHTSNKYNINSFEELINFLKQQQVIIPNLCIPKEHANISFGSNLYYNYKSIENIINGSNNILYANHDCYYFAKRSVFLKLINLYNDAFLKETNLDLKMFYNPESQFVIFCDNNSIDLLIYQNYDENNNLIEYILK